MSTNTIRALTCQEIVELVTDYVEGTMSPDLRASFEFHLSKCDGCTHYVEQMAATIRIAGTIERDQLPQQFRAGLIEAFKEFTP
ncbi:MAG TPA: zf-HC2 domain-containing protein [Gaiellaceae bacterium]|nr:zf-HC2 domain-containing protein [Gaiellaceae bacterium]